MMLTGYECGGSWLYMKRADWARPMWLTGGERAAIASIMSKITLKTKLQELVKKFQRDHRYATADFLSASHEIQAVLDGHSDEPETPVSVPPAPPVPPEIPAEKLAEAQGQLGKTVPVGVDHGTPVEDEPKEDEHPHKRSKK